MKDHPITTILENNQTASHAFFLANNKLYAEFFEHLKKEGMFLAEFNLASVQGTLDLKQSVLQLRQLLYDRSALLKKIAVNQSQFATITAKTANELGMAKIP